MTNDVTTHEPGPEEDDGFHGSLHSGRLLKGSYLKWTDAAHWVDRDGLTPPSPLLVIAINEVLQKWKDNKVEVIRDKPLPNPEQLNSAIPESLWERFNGKPRKPWAHVVVVYLVDLATGQFYTYASARHWRTHRLRRAQGSGGRHACVARLACDADRQSQRAADENLLRNASASAFRNHRLEDAGR